MQFLAADWWIISQYIKLPYFPVPVSISSYFMTMEASKCAGQSIYCFKFKTSCCLEEIFAQSLIWHQWVWVWIYLCRISGSAQITFWPFTICIRLRCSSSVVRISSGLIEVLALKSLMLIVPVWFISTCQQMGMITYLFTDFNNLVAYGNSSSQGLIHERMSFDIIHKILPSFG